MARHDELLDFIAAMADQFGAFRVVGIDPKDGTQLPITEIMAEENDCEICFVGDAGGANTFVITDFYASLQDHLERHPDYSLMVSKWFEIDAEHIGRADVPLKGVEVNEQSETLQLIY